MTDGRAKAIAAGCEHSIILRQDGSVWVTGKNSFGQLGTGAGLYPFTSKFVQVISSGIVAVAAGDWHSMIKKNDESLWATGQNIYGQLGDGSMIAKNRYVRVVEPRNGPCLSVQDVR